MMILRLLLALVPIFAQQSVSIDLLKSGDKSATDVFFMAVSGGKKKRGKSRGRRQFSKCDALAFVDNGNWLCNYKTELRARHFLYFKISKMILLTK